MAKLTNRAKQAEVTKNKIYECGIELVSKHGFDQITVEEIAKEAGVSVGTYYYYFASKFDLLKEIFKRADEYFETKIAGKLKSDDCISEIIEFFEEYADFNYRDGLEMVKKLYVSDNKMFITEGRAMQNILKKIVEAGQYKGQISKAKPSVEITNMLFIAARGVIFEWCLRDGEADLRALMNNVITVMMSGFKL